MHRASANLTSPGRSAALSDTGLTATARKKDKKQRRKARARTFSVDKNTAALSSLASERRPFEPLLKRVVEAVLHQHGPKGAAAASVVEVGSGLGQLRSLLPESILESVTHTELSTKLTQGFLQRHPDAKVLTADVAALPFDSGSVDAVLALCVFDSLSRPGLARDEVRRVLARGGTFVHFLDAATNIEPILRQLMDAGRLPLPNFLLNTSTLLPAALDLESFRRLLHPYIDLLSVPMRQFEGLLEVLTRAGHPMKEMLERYARPFLIRPFDSLAAARAFVALTGNGEGSRPLNQALTSLVSTLRDPAYSSRIPFDLLPHSTLTHFQQRLEELFSEREGFSQRMSRVVYARAFEKNDQDALRAHTLRVGSIQSSRNWPAPLGTPAEALHPEAAPAVEADSSPSTHVLREAAVYCFVAEKVAGAGLGALGG